jgi:hypothetical protein
MPLSLRYCRRGASCRAARYCRISRQACSKGGTGGQAHICWGRLAQHWGSRALLMQRVAVQACCFNAPCAVWDCNTAPV